MPPTRRPDNDHPPNRSDFTDTHPSRPVRHLGSQSGIRALQVVPLACDPYDGSLARPAPAANGISSFVPVSNKAHLPAQTAWTATR